MCLQCFTLMDQNRDGIIDKEDLKDMFAQIGKVHFYSQGLFTLCAITTLSALMIVNETFCDLTEIKIKFDLHFKDYM